MHFARRTIAGLPAYVVALLLGLSSCSKDSPSPVDPGNGGGGGGGTGGSVSDSVRTAVFRALDTQIQNLPRVNAASDNQTMLNYIRTRPEFEASGTLRGSVWARFRDGRVYVFVNNFSDRDTSSAVAPPTIKVSRLPGGAGPMLGENLPLFPNARIMNSLGSAFDLNGADQANFAQAKADITSWLTTSGYTNVPTTPTIDALKGVQSDGVVYWSSHGSYGIGRNNDTLYGVWTATERGFANSIQSTDTLYSDDLNDGSLIYFSAPHDAGIIFPSTPVKYAITHRFVTKYMSFGRHSLVFVNACLSDDDDFRGAVLSKGAALYMGWDNYANAARACRIGRFYFDRALGMNQERPVQTPPQKAYQLYDVYPFMQGVGLTETDVDRGGGNAHATLNANPSLSDLTQLRPIMYAMEGTATEASLAGWFGPDPGADGVVEFGGRRLAVRLWTENQIRTEPVTSGGEVRVTVRGLRSNTMPLSEFRLTGSIVVTGRGTLRRTIDYTIDFTMNVVTYRTRVDGPVSDWPSFRAFQPLPGSSATYTASGEYRDNNGQLVESWSGGGSLPLVPYGSLQTGISLGGVIAKPGTPSNLPFCPQLTVNGTFLRNGTPASLSIFDLGYMESRLTTGFEYLGGRRTRTLGNESWEHAWNPTTARYLPAPGMPR